MRRNIVLGGFLVFSLLGITVLTFRLVGLSLQSRETWTVFFGADASLEEGLEVIVAGKKVGVVEAVDLLREEEMLAGRFVRARLSVNSDVLLWEGAEVRLVANALLGGHTVVLRRGDPRLKRLAPDTPLTGRRDPGVMEELATVVRENRDHLRTFTSNLAEAAGTIQSGEGTLGRLVRDDRLYDRMAEAMEHLADLARAASSKQSSLGQFVRDGQIYEDTRATMRNIREITDAMNAGKGVLGALVRDDTLVVEARDLLKGARELVDSLRRGEGALGAMLRDPDVREEMVKGIRAGARFLERLDQNDGTLGFLLRDKQVGENLLLLSENLRAVSEDLRAGRGSLGLLLKDESIYRELQRTIEAFRETGEVARENAPLASLTSFTSLFFSVLN